MSAANTIAPRIIELKSQRISLDPTQTNDGSQLTITTSQNDPSNMEALERIANDWTIQVQRAQHTCEVERASNEVTCSTDMPLPVLAGMMPDLVDRITRELGGGTDSGRAMGVGASGGNNTGGGYEPGDWILDPGDARCPRWAFEDEAKDEMHGMAIGTSALPRLSMGERAELTST